MKPNKTESEEASNTTDSSSTSTIEPGRLRDPADFLRSPVILAPPGETYREIFRPLIKVFRGAGIRHPDYPVPEGRDVLAFGNPAKSPEVDDLLFSAVKHNALGCSGVNRVHYQGHKIDLETASGAERLSKKIVGGVVHEYSVLISAVVGPIFVVLSLIDSEYAARGVVYALEYACQLPFLTTYMASTVRIVEVRYPERLLSFGSGAYLPDRENVTMRSVGGYLGTTA